MDEQDEKHKLLPSTNARIWASRKRSSFWKSSAKIFLQHWSKISECSSCI